METVDKGPVSKVESEIEDQLVRTGITSKLGILQSMMNDTFSQQQQGLTPNARKVLERRYLKKNANGDITETPEELFRRVAHNIAQADLYYDPKADTRETEEIFYKMMTNLEFLPNSPTLMNAGRELQQLSACFVLPIGDSMEEIFTTIKDTAMIHKSGGGTGFSFSRLRPANSRVASTSGVSSGPISFMRVFDSATEAIKQGGTRRGANMGILRVDHPDIREFISCKSEEKGLNNFNISIAITEEFMNREGNDEEYELYDPHTKQATKKLRAKEVFNTIVSSAWKNGEPGIIFIDRLNSTNPTPHVGEIESTNPCGEQPLLPYESCNLGSINLAKMTKEVSLKGEVVSSSAGMSDCEIDWDLLSKTVHNAVHFLDNVIDMNHYPLEKIDDMTKGNRKIGLGVMGFADMLIRIGKRYNSNAATELAEKVMSFIDRESKMASSRLTGKRGVFPNYEGSIYDSKSDKTFSPYYEWRLRNATTTTIAPTGTISIIANSSSGIEPLFAVSYLRTVMDKDELVEVNPFFEEVARKRGFYSEELMKEIAQKGSLNECDSIPDDVKNLFITSHDISPEWHIRMQAAFQKYTDNAVSKTINFHKEATEEDVKEAFLLAVRLGCKGLTIYRDGSREDQVLSTGATYSSDGKEGQAESQQQMQVPHIVPRPRPIVTKGTTQRIASGCGNLYITINECDEGKPFEIFTQMGKAGGCAASQSEAIGRLTSLALRSGIEPAEIAKQLIGISCHMMTWDNGEKVLSCSDAISKALTAYEKRLKRDNGDSSQQNVINRTEIYSTAKKKDENAPSPSNDGIVKTILISKGMTACPHCSGHNVDHAEGCVTCHDCGYSKC